MGKRDGLGERGLVHEAAEPTGAGEWRHPIGYGSPSAELEATPPGAWGRRLRRLEEEAGLRHLGRDRPVVLVEAVVRLEDVHRLLVHVLVGVVLQRLELVDPFRLVHELRVRVGAAGGWRLVLASLEHILDALEGNGHEARVVACEEVAQRLDASLLHQVPDLLRRAAARRVGNGPGRLLLDIKLSGGEEVHERRDDVRLDDRLDLLARPSRDVRNRPARLLANALLGRVELRRGQGIDKGLREGGE